MKAEEFLENHKLVVMWTPENAKLLTEYARLKCAEQRELSQNHYFMKHGCDENYDDNYIINSPEPEL